MNHDKIPQIGLMDRNKLLFVHVQNNGVGPLVVEKLIFNKGGEKYYRIQDCLSIDPKSYDHIEITDANKKVILPGCFLELFSKRFDEHADENTIGFFRPQLAQVDGWDIYNNKVVVEKSLHWFVRHSEMKITDKPLPPY